eukprot:scaffold14823_cov69-Phaeocystis_antarctica.AAC.2
MSSTSTEASSASVGLDRRAGRAHLPRLHLRRGQVRGAPLPRHVHGRRAQGDDQPRRRGFYSERPPTRASHSPRSSRRSGRAR